MSEIGIEFDPYVWVLLHVDINDWHTIIGVFESQESAMGAITAKGLNLGEYWAIPTKIGVAIDTDEDPLKGEDRYYHFQKVTGDEERLDKPKLTVVK